MNQKISFACCSALFVLIFACNSKAPEPLAATGFANETDFVCGMKVDSSYTDTCHYHDKVYAFCSQSCKEAFQAAPESFLNKEKGE